MSRAKWRGRCYGQRNTACSPRLPYKELSVAMFACMTAASNRFLAFLPAALALAALPAAPGQAQPARTDPPRAEPQRAEQPRPDSPRPESPRPEPRPAQPQPAIDPVWVERLMEADANGDGNVTRAELRAWRAQQFARMDRNNDGFIGEDDIPFFFASRFEERFHRWLRQFDANHDGRISRDEFVNGPTHGFDYADANHDGVVTTAEVAAALGRLRAQAAAPKP